ncbi:folate receptor alpha-like, partial [Mantella aurantiaca]
RILDVPLCIEDCDTWYKDCSGEYTCMENWHFGWNWTTKINRCPAGKPCRKLTAIFPTAKDFCEKVWSNSYKYTTHKRASGLCMQLWFQGANPNVAVAKYYADRNYAAPAPRPWPLALLLAPLCVSWAW